MTKLAIIPARSGSKGLKDKNIKALCGKPLLYYSIQAALEANIFSEIMLSTDSEYYAEIGSNFGASVPFLRAAELASDTASFNDLIKGIITQYKDLGKEFDQIMILQPTSPLRRAKDILAADQLFFEKSADFIISVAPADHPPIWSNTLAEDLSLQGFLRYANIPRQALATYYRLNGAIYYGKSECFAAGIDPYKSAKSYALIMDKESSVDIDDAFDFICAEALLKRRLRTEEKQ